MKTSENPFESSRLTEIPFRFPPGMSWQILLDRLEKQKYCAAVVGRLGSGKTTLLEELALHLEDRGFEPVLFSLPAEASMREKERLPEKLRQVESPGFILLDGAEQLSTRHWLPVRTAASKAAGFVVTVHRTSRLPTIFECEPTADLLDEIVEDLSGGKLPAHEAETLLARHHGNIRGVLQELHDRWGG